MAGGGGGMCLGGKGRITITNNQTDFCSKRGAVVRGEASGAKHTSAKHDRNKKTDDEEMENGGQVGKREERATRKGGGVGWGGSGRKEGVGRTSR